MLASISYTNVAALEGMLDVGEGEGVPLVDTIEDRNVALPDEAVDDRATKELLRQTMQELSEREQMILALYYFEGLTLRQIGDILGVTESRICQIHSKAVISLRSMMEEQVAG